MNFKFTLNGYAGWLVKNVIVNILFGFVNTFSTTGTGIIAQLRVIGTTVIS